jgi:hypothetical protein
VSGRWVGRPGTIEIVKAHEFFLRAEFKPGNQIDKRVVVVVLRISIV